MEYTLQLPSLNQYSLLLNTGTLNLRRTYWRGSNWDNAIPAPLPVCMEPLHYLIYAEEEQKSWLGNTSIEFPKCCKCDELSSSDLEVPNLEN